MNNLQKMDQEKNVLRWGGLAGMLGGIAFILTMRLINQDDHLTLLQVMNSVFDIGCAGHSGLLY